MDQRVRRANVVSRRGTTEEGWEVICVFDEACSDLVRASVDADVEPVELATKVVAAIISDQYGEYRALIRAIASAQPWAPAYVSDLKVLLPAIAGQAARSE
ncbi:hypothetical protein PPGU19_061880 (plasmid) [Paraburkholderia sp. PGU19]|nr:hypothetical protein PPGU19_061880 [Paraburkholderia sp. PGU19]